MPAAGPGAVGPVSARYAAQIRELLYAQAMQRMVADEEAARAKARDDAAARAEAAPNAAARVEKPAPVAAPAQLPEAAAAGPATTAQIVDIHA